MTTLDEATRAWQEILDSKLTTPTYRSALAGDGAGTVGVTGESDYIWCRYFGDQSKVSKVFNILARGVPEDFPLTIGKLKPSDEDVQVLNIDWDLYRRTLTEATVDGFSTPFHGSSHNAATGNDPAPIDLRNILEMRGRSQAVVDLTVHVEEGRYIAGDVAIRYAGGNLDLAASVPGVVGHRYVLVYYDVATGVLALSNGTIVPIAVVAPIPAQVSGSISICLVELAQNQTTITEDDIYDWRFLWDVFYPGGVATVTRVIAAYTALATDEVIFCDTDGVAFILSLPAGVEGTHYKLINCGSSGNDLTVDPNGAEELYGAGAGVASTVSDGEVIDIHYETTEGWW